MELSPGHGTNSDGNARNRHSNRRRKIAGRWICCLSLYINPVEMPNALAEEKDAFGLEAELPVALTPTRLRQPLKDLPASITIITSDMLAQFGIRSIAEAMRLVPGMQITEIQDALSDTTGDHVRINYHGTNILVPRRMNIRVDGVSAYQAGLARINWNTLPVAIEEIDRIEVTRGPESAVYGANSMLAVINIITKHPEDQAGSLLRISTGNDGTREISGRHGGKWDERTSYSVRVSRTERSILERPRSTSASQSSGSRVEQLSLHANTALSAREQFQWSATVIDSSENRAFRDPFRVASPDTRAQDVYLSTAWQKQVGDRHELRTQAYMSTHEFRQSWTTCVPRAVLLPELFTLWRTNPAYAKAILAGKLPSGGSALADALANSARSALLALGPAAARRVCVSPNQDYSERRLDWELQDTYLASDVLRIVTGTGTRLESRESQTYSGGRVSNAIGKLFGNIEYKPDDHMTVNLGAYAEFNRMSGTSVSPRIALNYHLSSQDTVRFTLSTGGRAPDMLEQRADWSYSVPEGRFYQSAVGNGNIRRERIVSRELGYIGNYPQYGLQLDAKLFSDSLTQLISEKLQLADFHPTNDNSARLRGAEFQLRYSPDNSWMAFANYTYLTNEASSILERTQYARHSGAAGVTTRLDQGWRLSLAAYANSANSSLQSSYGKQDLLLSKSMSLNSSSSLTLNMVVRHLQQRTVRYFQDFLRTRTSTYNNSMQYMTTLELHF